MGEPAMNTQEKKAGTGGAYVDVDTGHEYDGIREFDNRLPSWWLMTLWGAVVFSIGYWTYYHTTGTGSSSKEAYLAEVGESKKAEAERAAKAGVVTDDDLLALTKSAEALERGKQAYTTNCIACHKADGGGLVGPNLTDAFWIHGDKPTDLYKVVAEGVLPKGMPAWKPVLGPTTTQEVVAYVLTMKDTNVAGGKEPQGNKAGGAAEAPAPTPAPEGGEATGPGEAPPAEEG